jgi:Zn-dependent metalloprotease
MGYVLSYYYQTHEHNGWDGKGSDSKCHAHNESRSNDAYWSDLRQQIYFSSGNGTTHDFICTLAYVGHEFTHGVNYGYNRVQNYNGETGALNEAIADIFGALISLQHRADAPEPYIFGSQCSLSSHGYRNMSDPSRDTAGVVRYDATNDTTKYNSTLRGFCPDHYDIRYTGSDDYNGVHINCTIITHAVYLMMNGGTHRFSNVTVTGIGVEAVQEMLYRVVSTYLRETSNFEDFRTAFILACEELYPEYLITIKMAFHAVGIGPNPLVELAYFILE